MDFEEWAAIIGVTLLIGLLIVVAIIGKQNDALTVRVEMSQRTATIPVEYTPGDPMPDTLIFNGIPYISKTAIEQYENEILRRAAWEPHTHGR